MDWSPADVQRAHDIILRRTGIDVPANRSAKLTAALDAAASHLPDRTAALEAIDKQPLTSTMMRDVIELLTINETHFFRNRPQFEHLRSTLLPALIQENAPQRTLRVWSAACSSGEEPYSVAILLHLLLENQHGWDLHIIGTDIDEHVLAKARAAVYGAWSFREAPADLRSRYFTADGERVALDPAIRAMVRFEHLNLADRSWPARRPAIANMDLILCRNVLIYFRERQVQQIADQLFEALRPGGWLLVGHAEPNQRIFSRFVAHHVPGAVIYQRPRDPATLTPPSSPPRQATPQRTAPIADLHRLASRDPESVIRQLEQSRNLSVEHQLLLARLLAGRNRLREARTAVERVIARQTLNAEAHYLLGIIARESNDTQTALNSLRRAGFLDRDFALARVALAELLADEGETRRAHAELLSAAQLLDGKPATAPVAGDPDLNVGRLREQIKGRLSLLTPR